MARSRGSNSRATVKTTIARSLLIMASLMMALARAEPANRPQSGTKSLQSASGGQKSAFFFSMRNTESPAPELARRPQQQQSFEATTPLSLPPTTTMGVARGMDELSTAAFQEVGPTTQGPEQQQVNLDQQAFSTPANSMSSVSLRPQQEQGQEQGPRSTQQLVMQPIGGQQSNQMLFNQQRLSNLGPQSFDSMLISTPPRGPSGIKSAGDDRRSQVPSSSAPPARSQSKGRSKTTNQRRIGDQQPQANFDDGSDFKALNQAPIANRFEAPSQQQQQQQVQIQGFGEEQPVQLQQSSRQQSDELQGGQQAIDAGSEMELMRNLMNAQSVIQGPSRDRVPNSMANQNDMVMSVLSSADGKEQRLVMIARDTLDSLQRFAANQEQARQQQTGTKTANRLNQQTIANKQANGRQIPSLVPVATLNPMLNSEMAITTTTEQPTDRNQPQQTTSFTESQQPITSTASSSQLTSEAGAGVQFGGTTSELPISPTAATTSSSRQENANSFREVAVSSAPDSSSPKSIATQSLDSPVNLQQQQSPRKTTTGKTNSKQTNGNGKRKSNSSQKQTSTSAKSGQGGKQKSSQKNRSGTKGANGGTKRQNQAAKKQAPKQSQQIAQQSQQTQQDLQSVSQLRKVENATAQFEVNGGQPAGQTVSSLDGQTTQSSIALDAARSVSEVSDQRQETANRITTTTRRPVMEEPSTTGGLQEQQLAGSSTRRPTMGLRAMDISELEKKLDEMERDQTGTGERGTGEQRASGSAQGQPRGQAESQDFDGMTGDQLDGLRATIPGEPLTDYPIYGSPPKTSFSCQSQSCPGGYYADMESQCQVFHICQSDGRFDSFLCPNGTVFSQQHFVCVWWWQVDCQQSASFYKLNDGIYCGSMFPTGGGGSSLDGTSSDQASGQRQRQQQQGETSNASRVAGSQTTDLGSGLSLNGTSASSSSADQPADIATNGQVNIRQQMNQGQGDEFVDQNLSQQQQQQQLEILSRRA